MGVVKGFAIAGAVVLLLGGALCGIVLLQPSGAGYDALAYGILGLFALIGGGAILIASLFAALIAAFLQKSSQGRLISGGLALGGIVLGIAMVNTDFPQLSIVGFAVGSSGLIAFFQLLRWAHRQ